MTLRLNPQVTGTDRSCGHVQGTARTLFDSLGSTPYERVQCSIEADGAYEFASELVLLLRVGDGW